MTDHVRSFQTISTQEILDELNAAIEDHMAWLSKWHRGLVCKGAPLAKDLAYDPHHLCRFGSWYVKNQHKGLVNQPVLRSLARIHRDMHDRAQFLAERARDGHEIELPDYDNFMQQTQAFIAQTRRLEKAFARASSDLDPLTGLHNRQAMMRDLERERERFLRTGEPCCIGLGDLDHFKKVNDTYGHSAGDTVLLAAAECYLTHVRPYDAVYRYGGEEFLFCLPDTDITQGRKALDRVRHELETNPVPLASGEDLSVTASFGLAPMREDATLSETIELADQALYEAKDSGRNRVVAWEGGGDLDTLID